MRKSGRIVDVVGTGFTVLDRIYVDATTPASEELGGSCGNVLLSLAMLNRTVTPVLALGQDEVGNRLVGEFEDAGAETKFIRRCTTRRSPILAQHLDPSSGNHFFAFRCPNTNEDLPRYQPIELEDVKHALPALESCSVFYADRISDAIVDAMEVAAENGAFIYFEPSDMRDKVLIRRALPFVNVLKFSVDRISEDLIDQTIPATIVSIVTHGAAGLELKQGSQSRWFGAFSASVVRDTCGSGDMVSVGVIDWLLTSGLPHNLRLSLDDLAHGVMSGQRLAAENCAYVGARGLFRERGKTHARYILGTA
jgi:fructokinase